MMLSFWFITLLLCVIASLFIVVPLAKNKAALVGDQKTLNIAALKGSIQRWYISVALLIILPIIAYTMYWQLGAYQQMRAVAIAKQNAQAAQVLRKELGTPDNVIALLKQRLAQDPNSARGWFLLGRLYASQQNFDLAAQAFAKADQLQPNDPATLFQYAQALYLTQHSLQGKPTELLQQLLKLQPQNDRAKNLINDKVL